MPRQWLFRQPGGSEEGPVSSIQLRALVESGRVLPDTLVFTKDIGRWVEAKRIARLFAESPAVLRSAAAGVGGDQMTGAPGMPESAQPHPQPLPTESMARPEEAESLREAGADTDGDLARRKYWRAVLIASIIAIGSVVLGMRDVASRLKSAATSNERHIQFPRHPSPGTSVNSRSA